MRKLLFAALLAVTVFTAGCGADNDDALLPQFKGQQRVIAVFPGSPDRAQDLTDAFKSSPGLDELKVVWFVVGPQEITSNSDARPDRDRLETLHTVDGFQSVLVGLDGKIIASQLGGLDIQALLDSLNQMPTEQ